MFHYIKDLHLDLFPKSDHDNKHEDAITKVDFLEIPTFKSCFSLFFVFHIYLLFENNPWKAIFEQFLYLMYFSEWIQENVFQK